MPQKARKNVCNAIPQPSQVLHTFFSVSITIRRSCPFVVTVAQDGAYLARIAADHT
jgi:hypothetical protein